MLGRTHQIGGICGAIVLGSFIFPPPVSLSNLVCLGVMTAGATLGSLLPDIDHPNATISKRAKGLSLFINQYMGHRGWTHTLLAFFIVTACGFILLSQLDSPSLILEYAVFGISLGYFSHLLLDSFTDSGIPAFKPLTQRRLRFASFKTGRVDLGAQILLIVATSGILYLQYFSKQGEILVMNSYKDFVLGQLEENLDLEIITKEQFEDLKTNHLEDLSRQMELFYLNCPDMTSEEELEQFHKYMLDQLEK